MKDNVYTAGQIREMLALSRSAIRYYVGKGLISVEKNDENGYQTFSEKNFSDLRDISYLRYILGFGIKDIQNCFEAASPDEYGAVFRAKSVELEKEIRQLQNQLKRIKMWEYNLEYLEKYSDLIQVVEFPEAFVFSPVHKPELDDIPFLGVSFELDGKTAVFDSYGYCHNELELDELESLSGAWYRFPGGKYIYSMFSSEREMDDPSLIAPVLTWAEKHEIAVRSPILVDYFFRIRNGKQRLNYYAVTVPFADCDIQKEK